MRSQQQWFKDMKLRKKRADLGEYFVRLAENDLDDLRLEMKQRLRETYVFLALTNVALLVLLIAA